MQKYARLIRDIPDFPKKGVVFKDITTLIKNGKAFDEVIDIFYEQLKGKKLDKSMLSKLERDVEKVIRTNEVYVS